VECWALWGERELLVIVLYWVVRTTSWDFKPGKKNWWAGALLSGKCCCFVR